MAFVHIESRFAKNVPQIMHAEKDFEETGEVHLETELNADKLQIFQFVDLLDGHC